MKKFFALLCTFVMVASLFAGVAFAAGTYTVAFDGTSSNKAGANSVLAFTFTDDVTQTVVINFGTTGFVPNGAATWTDATGVTTNIVGNVITINRTNAVAAAVVKVPVTNPTTAKNVEASTGFTVTTSATAATSASVLAVQYTVTATPAAPLAGSTGNSVFNVTQNGVAVTVPLSYAVYRGDTSTTPIAAGTTSNGSFTAAIAWTILSGESQVYNVVVTNGATPPVTGSWTYTLRNVFSFSGVTDAKMLETRTITGTLSNSAGGIPGKAITLRNKSANNTIDLAGGTTLSNGTFAFTHTFNDAAVYALWVGNEEYATF
ncbi:MAG: hypothetical protein Q8N36_05885, partial [bacterium]|nr:hypothetical protein [bacterium]